ncbi:MAG TPA: DUF523 and DUF1722 domain-containing protein [Anaeromyxobacteraceae bacterium]|nr:DUF523 and DUF1722 domain-containing protein [Anaeromyxobacteraceae bacterium]
MKWLPATGRIRIGVSACLLGRAVRYDGGHKKDAFVAGPLARLVDLVAVCPEVEVGMGTPREPVRLVRLGGEVRMMGRRSRTDHTAGMRRWARARARALEKEDLCGFLLKSDSPSCGAERVKVYAGGRAARNGRGLFAEALMERMPLLPVAEERRLGDPRLRKSFVERAFAYRRLKSLLASRWTAGDLIRFHSAERLLLLAHDPAACRALGRLVEGARGRPRREVALGYGRGFMRALEKPATPGKHVDVLQRMAGSLGDLLPAEERKELEQAIVDFRRGRVPLAVPLALLRRQARRHRVAWLEGQTYLNVPSP